MSESKQSAGRRLSVITIDQAIAGASNVLTAVLAARVLGVASFGLFGIVFLTYTIALSVMRALVSDPLLVHPFEAQERLGDPIGTTGILSLGLGLFVLLVGGTTLLWDHTLGAALMVLGACFPLLALQDLGRYLGFMLHKPERSVVLDSVWLILLFAATPVLFVTHARTLAGFILAWGGTGAVSGLILFTQTRLRDVNIRFNLTWLRFTWPFSWRYLISYMATQGTSLVALSGVGAVAGAKQLGGVQGAALLSRPFSVFQVATIAGTVSEISRADAHDQQVRRRVKIATAITTGVAVITGAVLLAIPTRLGKVVLGASWHATHPLLLPTAVQLVFLGVLTGMRAGLLGLRQAGKVMKIDVFSTIIVTIATVTGAAINGAKGALWAVAIGQGAMAIVWCVAFWLHQRRALPKAPASGGEIDLTPIPPGVVPTVPALPAAPVTVPGPRA